MNLYTDRVDSLEKLRMCEAFRRHASACTSQLGTITEVNFWRAREYLRTQLASTSSFQHYRLISIIDGLPFTVDRAHYLHHSKSSMALVAYTPDEAHGIADKQTVLKLGKYLTKFFKGEINNETIKSIVAAFKYKHEPPELLFASTEEEIIRIYEKGPSSCMTGKGWHEHNHPCRVYAGPNTKVAYIVDPNKRITARTVIRTDTNPWKYVRIYGDETRLRNALNAAGFKKADNYVGVRFPIIGKKDSPCYISMPYLDGNIRSINVCEDDPKFFEIIRNGVVSAGGTDGFKPHPYTVECAGCNRRMFKKDATQVHGYQSSSRKFCAPCAAKTFRLAKGPEGKDVHYRDGMSDLVVEYSGHTYLIKSIQEYGLFIKSDGTIVPIDTLPTCSLSDRPLTNGYLIVKTDPHSEGKLGFINLKQAKDIYISKASGRAFMYKPRASQHISTLHEVALEAVNIFGAPLETSEVRTMFHKDINQDNLKLLLNFINTNYIDAGADQ